MIQAAQLILSLSILVVLHELGHFIPAKLFKTKVEKFYLFFDPWFSLFKKKIGDTVYGIGWLPLGGYVKIAGMIDESMDKDQMKKEPEPWEFRAKPAWQRLIIMIGGVTVNVILAMFIYAMMLFTWGSEYIPTQNMSHGIYVDSLGQEMGFRNGDKILKIEGKEVEKFREVINLIAIEQADSVTVMRDGEEQLVRISSEAHEKILTHRKQFMAPALLSVIDTLIPGMPAAESGLQKGDRIIGVNGTPTYYHQDVGKKIRANKNDEVSLDVMRGRDTLVIAPVPVTEDGTIGFSPFMENQIEPATRKYTFFESFPAGVKKGVETLDGYVSQMALIFTSEQGYKSLGGFITIGKQFGSEWDWQRFWGFTAFLSIILAIMNMLPIPALDGGHVIFLLYEILTGRKPNEKVLEYAQIVGMVLLLALLLWANGQDIMRLFE